MGPRRSDHDAAAWIDGYDETGRELRATVRDYAERAAAAMAATEEY